MYDKKNVIHIDLSDRDEIAADVERMVGRSFIPTIKSKGVTCDNEDISLEEKAVIFSEEKDLFGLELLTEVEKMPKEDLRLIRDVEKINNMVAVEMQEIEKEKSDRGLSKNEKIGRIRKILKNRKLRSVNDERCPGDLAIRSRKEELDYAAYMRVKELAKECGGIGPFIDNITKQTNKERDEKCGPFKRCKWDLNDGAFLEREDFNELSDDEKRDLIGGGDYVVGEKK